MCLFKYVTIRTLSLDALGLGAGCVINEQSVQIERVRQDVITNVVASDAQAFEVNGITALDGHFNCFQVSVHAHIHT
jgi:hypothetical protein